jgi:hypothetical protein
MKINRVLIGISIGLVSLLFLFHIIDIIVTLIGVSRFGLEAEGNLLVRGYIANGELWKWFLWKIGLGSLLLFCVFLLNALNKIGERTYKRIHVKVVRVLLIGMNLVLIYFVGNMIHVCYTWYKVIW